MQFSSFDVMSQTVFKWKLERCFDISAYLFSILSSFVCCSCRVTSCSLGWVPQYVAMSLILFLLPIICLLPSVYSLEVTPNSDCASFCIIDPSLNPAFENSSHTNTNALVCNDWELSGPNSTEEGRTFHDCLQCESSSTAVDKESKENDVYWFLCKLHLMRVQLSKNGQCR